MYVTTNFVLVPSFIVDRLQGMDGMKGDQGDMGIPGTVVGEIFHKWWLVKPNIMLLWLT